MQREEVLPEPPSNLNQLDKKLFIKHFANRYEVEKNTYGNLSSKEVFKGLTNNPEFNKTEDIFDQEKFALLSRKLIEKLGYGEQLGELDEAESDKDENNQDEVEQEEAGQASDNEEDDK